MTRIAAMVAACTAIACGSKTAPPPVGPPVGHQGSGAAVDEPTGDPRCGHAADADLPARSGPAAAGVARGIVVDGLDHPLDGVAVKVTGGQHRESRGGHDVVVIEGESTTWTDATGGFRLSELGRFMDQLVVEYQGITITCPRAPDDTSAFKIQIQGPAI